MILSCPSCAKRFMLDARLLGEGRRVKCGQCGHVWFAEPDMAVAPSRPVRAARAPAPAKAPAKAVVERPGSDGARPHARSPAPSRPAARNAPPPEPAAAARPSLFDDNPVAGGPEDDDLLNRGFESADFQADADDLGMARPFRPRPMPKGSNLPALPGKGGRVRRAAIVAWGALLLAVGGAGTGIVMARDSIIQAWPASFLLYEMVGLAELPGTGLSDPGDPATTKVEVRDVEGVNLLFVTGEIANRSGSQRSVPDIQAVALGQDGKELYAWRIIPPVRRLFPNQTTTFQSRMPEREGTQASSISFRYVAPEPAPGT